MSEHPSAEGPWGWEHHARDQRLRFSRLTLIEKLQWLEETHRLVLHLQKSRLDAGTVRERPRQGLAALQVKAAAREQHQKWGQTPFHTTMFTSLPAT